MTPTELTVSLYMRRCVSCGLDGPMCLERIVPHADEVDVNVNGERLLEGRRLRPSLRIVARVHFVGEGHLLVIACRQQADLPDHVSALSPRIWGGEGANLVKHTSERASGVCASREAEETDLVAFLICTRGGQRSRCRRFSNTG